MTILYNRGKFTYLVKYDSKVYLVSIGPNKRAAEIDDVVAQELLQAGFWEVFKKKSSKELEDEILKQIKKRN